MPEFSRYKLLLRNLRHFRAANLATVAGMVVATAVLTGALMVGDSVRGSLRDLAENRLGFVDHALVSPRFLDQPLAQRLAEAEGFRTRFESITPGITLRGGAARADAAGGAKVAGVQITALADRYAVPAGEAQINPTLSQSLGGGAGPALRFSLPAPNDAPRESTLARRSRNDTITTFEVQKSQVTPAGGFLDLFNLSGTQRQAPSAWLNIQTLQEELDRANQVNLLLVAARPGHSTPADAEALNKMLAEVATLSDYGLDQQKSADTTETVFGSKSTYIPPAIADAADRAATAQHLKLRKASVYLVNAVVKQGTPVQIHYAIAAGISDIDGQPLADTEIVVNQWTADQLHLKLGDFLVLAYYQRQPNGDLTEVTSDRPDVGLRFTVTKILPMQGLGADKTLTPTYKGLTDADTMADWRPPAGVNINKKLVTPADEKYWSQYKAAPKIFISLSAAKKLWGNAFGDLTSLRVPADNAAAFEQALKKEINPATLGMVFQPIKHQQLAAASGSTDFAGLFIGFSFFLLIAAVMLVAMLFRLSIEQRARQLGLLAACGFAPRQLRNLALKEGLLLATLGAILGTALAVAYTALMIHGLRTWWLGAIGTTALHLHVLPETLCYGFVGSIIIAMLAILWAVRRISKSSPSTLLAGGLETSAVRLNKPPRISRVLAIIGLIAAVGLFVGGALGKIGGEAAFLGGGSVLLLAALSFTFAQLRPARHAPAGLSVVTLAMRNATRNRTRSLLCVTLIALASFTLVTVSSMESTTPTDTFEKKSGAGGYGLIVETDIPLLGNLNSLEGRQLLMRLPSAKDPRWEKANFTMMRSWAGQDISCLNITQPNRPSILSVPKSMIEENRFAFAQPTKSGPNPWTVLSEKYDDAEMIPVILDDNAARYILASDARGKETPWQQFLHVLLQKPKFEIGETLTSTDAAGRPIKLKLVATMSGTVFQSAMLMDEANFLRLFPAQSGFSTILVQVSAQDTQQVEELLRNTLNDEKALEQSDYSAVIETTASRLAKYQEVENTYLATFRVLGSLGLMLGTIGLAVVLIRNLIERRPELALLSALGFDPATRTRLVLWENISLLLLGLFIGSACALAGVIPNVLTSAHQINIPALSIALAAVLVVGLTALLLAVRFAGRRVTPAALRAE